jgi:imidazolonepropionase-like amidohydrolase
VIDLSERTVSPGFIDTHVHLTMDASNLVTQTLQSSVAKTLGLISRLHGVLRATPVTANYSYRPSLTPE